MVGNNNGMNSSRREFIGSVASLALSIPASVFGQPKSVPSLEILDSHTHFYDPERPQGVPWPPKSDEILHRRILPADYKRLDLPNRVGGTIVVEASSWVEDNQWIIDLASRDVFIRGFVGNLPVGKVEFKGLLERFAPHKVFRGIRISSMSLKNGLGDSRFMDDLKMLAAGDLSLDLLGGPETLGFVPKLAREIPKLRIMIDHLGGVPINGANVPVGWIATMKEAAKEPNVYCKFSGFVEGTGKSKGDAPSEVSYYKTAFDSVWESFGENRLVYGSNWPVCERFAPCSRVQQLCHDYFLPKGEAVLKKVFAGNALQFYKPSGPDGRV